jgi:hypothetical protein
MFLMSLDIGAELKLAMFGVVHLGANNNCAWAEGIGDPIVGGEAVESEPTVVDHLDGHANGEALEWWSVVDAVSALLDCVNMTIHLGDVLVIRHGIRCQVEISKIAPQGLELTVHQNGFNDEAALTVNTLNMSHSTL